MTDYDVHIKGGTVVDGTRVPRFRGDVWIKDGRIAQIGGRPNGMADRVIDAEGLIVAPGFVDLHTHYDAQIRWDPWCSISSWHGVTSVVLGNCGFGFAPCRPEFRERSMLTMVRTEAIPLEAMRLGMNWDWETIPEYLDSLDATPKGVNCLQYMPVAPLMIYVMGRWKPAKSRCPAIPRRHASEMQHLLHEGMDAGLCGFSIQRLGEHSVQADFDGTPMVTDTMADKDILALCQVLAERNEGFIQVTQATGNIKADLAFVEKMAKVANRPILHNLVFAGQDPKIHTGSLKWLERTNDKGLRIFGQGATLRSGFAFTLADWNLYDASEAWNEATTGTKEEKLRKMADPEMRERLKAEIEEAEERLARAQNVTGPIPKLIVQGVNRQANLQSYVGKSVGQIAEEEGKHYIDAMLDLSIAGDLNVEFLGPERGSNATNTGELMTQSPYTFPGVSDGGAHTKFFNGGAYTTDFLLWLVRDEKKITLEEAHFRLSALPAHAAGFRDRGMLREGAPADVVVYELESLDVKPRWVGEVVKDLPGGEWRPRGLYRGRKARRVGGRS